jgi:hypothetical protein
MSMECNFLSSARQFSGLFARNKIIVRNSYPNLKPVVVNYQSLQRVNVFMLSVLSTVFTVEI